MPHPHGAEKRAHWMGYTIVIITDDHSWRTAQSDSIYVYVCVRVSLCARRNTYSQVRMNTHAAAPNTDPGRPLSSASPSATKSGFRNCRKFRVTPNNLAEYVYQILFKTDCFD